MSKDLSYALDNGPLDSGWTAGQWNASGFRATCSRLAGDGAPDDDQNTRILRMYLGTLSRLADHLYRRDP